MADDVEDHPQWTQVGWGRFRAKFNNPIFTHRDDEGFVMVVGPTTHAILVEVGYIVSDENTPVIVHAMRPARRKLLL